MTLFGIDGCKAGWVVAEAEEDLRALRFSVVATASQLFDEIEPEDWAVIDIPIGLPTDKARACESAARRLLSPNAAVVFSVPCRDALSASTYEHACELNRAMLGLAMSRQTFGILPRIREVDQEMTPERQRHIREAHPEVVFRSIAGRILAKKKTPEGVQERLHALKAHGIVFDPAVERTHLGRGVAIDDLLDAAACLLAARAVANGEAQVLGDGELDARGLRMEMVTLPVQEGLGRSRVVRQKTERQQSSDLARIISDLRRLQAVHPNDSSRWAYFETAVLALERIENR